MVQATEKPAAGARDELRGLLSTFRNASADLRQEVIFARDRRSQAIQAAQQARTNARAAADKAFARVTTVYDRARTSLSESSKLSRSDRTTRLELLLGGFSGLGEGAPPPSADPAKEIATHAAHAEQALQYIRTALGEAGGRRGSGVGMIRLVAGLIGVLGLSLAATSLFLSGSAMVTLVGLALTVAGVGGAIAAPSLVGTEHATSFGSPVAAFEQLARALAGARRAYRRWTEDIDAALSRSVREADAAYQQAIDFLKPVFEQARANVDPGLSALRRDLRPWLLDWTDEAWASWTPAVEPGAVLRIGTLLAGADAHRLEAPAFLPLPPTRALLIKAPPSRQGQASGLVTAVLFRLLAALPPEQVTFSIVDPLGRGASLNQLLPLGDYDEQFVRGRVWVDAEEIEAELGALLDLATARKSALRLATDPLHVVVVLNFPEAMGESSAIRLWRLMQQGPSVRIWPIVLADLARPAPIGVRLADLEGDATVIAGGKHGFILEEDGFSDCELRPDDAPSPAVASRIVQQVGGAVSRYTLLFDQVAPERDLWWQGDAGNSTAATIGAWENGNPAALILGGESAEHLAIVGGPESGKSSLLRTLAISLALAYSPRELEILLFDASNGRLLAPFDGRAPHLRFERLTTAQELPLKLFQPVRAELDRRSALRRNDDLTSLTAFRRRSGNPLSRVVVMIDALDELFARGGPASSGELAKLLSSLISVPGDSGVQAVLSFRSLARIPQPIKGLIPRVSQAIVLPLPPADATTLLGQNSEPPGAPGHALALPVFARPERRPLLTAHLGDARLDYYLGELEELAGRR
ncbi:MAG: FtsK/SpoIIIE domain-containing protein [Dehalococcoidia bacterium]